MNYNLNDTKSFPYSLIALNIYYCWSLIWFIRNLTLFCLKGGIITPLIYCHLASRWHPRLLCPFTNYFRGYPDFKVSVA